MKSITKRRIMQLLFAIYLLIAIYLLFFHTSYRTKGNIWGVELFSLEHLQMANFVPFRTITTFFTRLAENTINTDIVVVNILGNMLLLAPLGCFIPELYKNKFNKFWKFLLLVLVLDIGIELIQFVTFTGSLDVDDIILNTIGACIAYAIMKINFVYKIFDSNTK